MSLLFIVGIGIILINYQATEGTKLFRLNSSKARLTSIVSAVTVIKDHPLLGVGFNAYRYAMHKYGFAVAPNWQYSHSDAGTDNSFLFVIATTGIFGFISFIYLLFTVVKKLLNKISLDPMKILSFTSLVVLSVGSLFINAFFYPLILSWMWIIFGLTEI
jgi:O-antigen ligase